MNNKIHSNKNNHLKGLSIKLKRLQWKEVMKKRFWKKCRISRGCISRICRQLLNIELKMRKERNRQPLSAIEDNKSSCTPSDQNIRVLKRTPEFEESKIPPRKKLKLGNENFLSFNKGLPEERDFAGFTSSMRSVSTAKNGLLTTSRNGQESQRRSIAFVTKTGVKLIATKAISLPKSKALSGTTTFKKISATSPLRLMAVNSVLKDTTLDGGDAKAAKIVEKDDTEQCPSESSEKHHLPQSDNHLQKGEEDLLDVESSSVLDKDKTDDDDETSTKTNEIETKEERKINEQLLPPNGIDKKLIGLFTGEEEEEEDDDEETKFSTKSSEDTNDEAVGNKDYRLDSSSSEGSLNGSDDSDSFKSKVKVESRRSSSLSSSSSSTICLSGSVSPHSSDSENEAKNHDEDIVLDDEAANGTPPFDPTKFLSCDIDTAVGNENKYEEEIPFIKSQNYQLNCEVRVVVAPLTLKDITNTFCYQHNISGICGFRIRRALQALIFQSRVNKSHARYLSTTIPANQLHSVPDNQSTNDWEESEPSPVPLLDPFTHSLFGPIISRDRKKVKHPKGRGDVRSRVFSEFVKSLKAKHGNPQFRSQKPYEYGAVLECHKNRYNLYKVLPQHRNPYLAETVNMRVPGDVVVRPPFVNLNNGGGGGGSVAADNDSLSIVKENIVAFKPSDSLKAYRVSASTTNSPQDTIPPSVPGNTSLVLPPGSNYSYVVLPQGMTPSMVQIRGSQVICHAAPVQNPGQPGGVQRPSYIYQTQRVNHPPAAPPPGLPSTQTATRFVNPVQLDNLTTKGNTNHQTPSQFYESPETTDPLQCSVNGSPPVAPIQVAPVSGIPTIDQERVTYSAPSSSYIVSTSHIPSHSHVPTISYAPSSHIATPSRVIPHNINPLVHTTISSHVLPYVNINSRIGPHPHASSTVQVMNQHSMATTASTNSSSPNISLMTPPPPNQGPPPLKLGNIHIGKVPQTTMQQNLSLSQPPQLKKMGSTSLASKPAAQVPETQPPQLPPAYGNSTSSQTQANEWDSDGCQSNLERWLRKINQPYGPCKRNALLLPLGFVDVVVNRLKEFVEFGFPGKASSLLNAAYQMLIGATCCPQHVAEFIRKSDLLSRLRVQCLLVDTVVSDFMEPTIPILPCDASSMTGPSVHDLFILKRFVFAVDRKTRVILYPLPPFCVPKESDTIDKITVVVLVSPRLGLGPGLIIFPHSILDRKLRLSLGETGNLGKNWAVSAHQRGGLTQSMMIEFMNGEGQRWLMENQNSLNKAPQLAVDWWFCIDLNDLDEYFKQFTKLSLPLFFPSHRDPLDICLGVALCNMWGLLTRNWRNSQYSHLVEDKFPRFIHKTLAMLCEPSRLGAWCRSSGLQPMDYAKSKTFMEEYAQYV